MFVAPWFVGNWSWVYVQDVLDRWQGLNVGMLAFVSSVIAFNISRFNADKQRAREFAASKAFLPSALSELSTYFVASAAVFKLGWESQHGVRPDFVIPAVPEHYKEVFSNCIQHAQPEVGEYLSIILMRMQVHDARLRDYVSDGNCGPRYSPEKHNLIPYLYRLAELQAMVGKLFSFARGLEPFDRSPLVWEDFRNAFGGLGVWADEIEMEDVGSLEAFTKRAIARNSAQDT